MAEKLKVADLERGDTITHPETGKDVKLTAVHQRCTIMGDDIVRDPVLTVLETSKDRVVVPHELDIGGLGAYRTAVQPK